MRTSIVIAPGFSTDGVSLPFRSSGRKFNVASLPVDIRRVYRRLREEFGEDYALTVVFTIRTAVELHRAWHMTLLTTRLLQQIKDKFKLRMTWNLGVTDLVFRVEDGLHELHRRVPYDYDSEFQNMYEKTAMALVEGHIGIHDALIYQTETKKGKHTCKSGLFLRGNPGRLVLYPLQAATCCVIFFGGDLRDAGVAAVCGIMAGLIEWALSSKSIFANVNDSKLLIDFLIGLSTGIIGGLFYRSYNYLPNEDNFCLQAVFLGTLYWFFYGTAFVIGLLEIIAGELQTGVTRFLAVSVKTFVLSVGSATGLTLMLSGSVYDNWTHQFEPGSEACGTMDLDDKWWRLPLYILCSVSVLGQYRFIIMNYWAGLIVQVAAYEAQYGVLRYYEKFHKYDGMDTVISDMAGAISSVVAATLVCFTIDSIRYHSNLAVLEKNCGDKEISTCGHLMNKIYDCWVSVGTVLGLGKGLSSRTARCLEKLEELSKTQGKEKSEVKLSEEEEATMIEAAVEAQESNVWSLLMPAVYQLVPGSKLAQVWYSIIFPTQRYVDSSDVEARQVAADAPQSALWLTSVALALGLMLGLTIVRLVGFGIMTALSPFQNRDKSEDEINERNARMSRQYERQTVINQSDDYDPSDYELEAEFDEKYGPETSSDTNQESPKEIEDVETDQPI